MEGLGYIIPIPVLKHFLEDFEKNGSRVSFPGMPFDYEKMESAALRRYYKMQAGQTGVLVQDIDAGTHAKEVLKQGNISAIQMDGGCVSFG